MFRLICIIALAATALALAGHYAITRSRRPIGPAAPRLRRVGLWGRLAFGAVSVSGLGLGGIGLYAAIAGSGTLSGWLLLAHMSFAPVFAVSLAVMAVTWAGHAGVSGSCAAKGNGGTCNTGALSCGQKGLFWLTLVLGLAAMLSALLAMKPGFGAYGQCTLNDIHRITALLLVMVLMGQLYLHSSGGMAEASREERAMDVARAG